MREKVRFISRGITLAGALERPAHAPRAYALFAHCFTCRKDIAAASRISRKLVELGYAVLRFDFTGLGNSEGDFANTNFSSNLDDLMAAARFLESEYRAPSLLIGHSLGGAAVLAMAARLHSVRAVVAIAAPAGADPLIKNLQGAIEQIEAHGEAEIHLGVRSFTIKKQFIDDLRNHEKERFDLSGKALLLMHSPADSIVPIEDAETIYRSAKHPKSFISLDTADHMLSDRADAEYAATAIAGWASRYLAEPLAEPAHPPQSREVVVVEEKDHKLTQTVTGFNHVWLADEPVELGGKNLGPSPYDHRLAALGSCTAMTLLMYARHKGIALKHIRVTLSLEKYENSQELIRRVRLEGDLSDAERGRLLEIANRCPVHRTLTGDLKVTTALEDT